MGVMRREPRETGGGDGVGSAPLVVRSLFSFGGSVMSLGAEPTNVCRNDDIVEWCSDGCIKVGDIEVWAYYYFYEGENPDLCNWEDRMEIKVEECWI